MKKVIIKAYAKINLTLDVFGKRTDGYHEVKMIMQGIDLYDTLEIEKTRNYIELICNLPELMGPDNLAFRAAEMLKKKYDIDSGIKINLHKKIPVEAGLGGGSTNAAAVILGVNKLFSLNLTMEEMRKEAARLGSDIPFCLQPLTALARGRGEIIEDINPCPLLWMVLLKPPFGLSTREVYNHLQLVNIENRPDSDKIIKAFKNNNLQMLYENTANVLEYAAFDLYPQLRVWAEEIQSMGAKKVLISGSGPTLIAFHDSEEKAKDMASFWTQPKWQVFTVRTLCPEDIKTRSVYYE